MNNTFSKIMTMFFATTLFFACEETRETLDFTSDVDIHSFSINGVEGIISAENATIFVILPNGTDLSALAPQISIAESATISPANSATVDFSNSAAKGNEVVYTVANGDLYQKYKVSVDVAQAKITSFRIGTIAGTIDDAAKTITVYLPAGTDVTALIPIVEYTDGATISPEDGTPVDFTNPVPYTLSLGASDFVYTVAIHLGEPPIPQIVIYNGEDVCPQWAGIAGVVESPCANPKTDGINTSLLCASILRNGADTDDGGKAWSGGALWNSYKVNIDPAIYGSFSLKVLKGVQGDVQLEIQGNGETNKDWLKVWYSDEHLGEWQELIFQIPEGRTAVINNILVAPHCHDAGQPTAWTTQRMYWDNLKAIPK
jgi:hypothetical protein